MNSHTTTHRLSFDTPTTRDYLNGGFGDLVAQCSCGAFEFVYSRREGAYWHGLHCAQPGARPQFLLVDSPMPEGWESTPEPSVAPVPARSCAPRVYTCTVCVGAGSVSAFGAHDGRFYQFGERAVCSDCGGSGTTSEWAA